MRLVALTGYGQEEDRDRAGAAGFDDHLLKPANMDALRQLLARRPELTGTFAKQQRVRCAAQPAGRQQFSSPSYPKTREAARVPFSNFAPPQRSSRLGRYDTPVGGCMEAYMNAAQLASSSR